MNDLVQEFDAIIEEAPIDFLGTGSDSRLAAKCEREWRQRCDEFKKKLITLTKSRKSVQEQILS